MPTVTRISEHPRKPGRYVVEADGQEVAIVSAEVLAETRVAVGGELSAADEARLRDAGAEVATYDRAVSLLAFRARSARDLRLRLLQKGEPAPLVDRAVERLTALGLLDDAEFARQVARTKAVAQGASKRRVQQELFRRGVARGVADEAIGEVFAEEDVDETAAIEAIARKRLRSLGGLDAPTRRRRLYAFLARRGYDGAAIRSALARVLGEDGADAGDGGDDVDDPGIETAAGEE